MPYGNGRNREFGEEVINQGAFGEMKDRVQRANVTYQPRSVLESTRSTIGMSDRDRPRALLNGDMLPSLNGRSQSTQEKRQALGLDSPYRGL